MPDSWRALFEGPTGSLIAAVLGAFLRGVIGPGQWSWSEFWRAAATGVVFALWIGPGLAEQLDLGPRGAVSIGVIMGMVALPIARGLIQMARQFRDEAATMLERFLDRLFGGPRR